MKYRDVEFNLSEAREFREATYTVKNKDGMVYRVTSPFGASYGKNPGAAIEGAERQVDAALGVDQSS